THASRAILERLGLWARFDDADVSVLRHARVSNGEEAEGMRVSAADGGSRQLGWLVPNHVIRRAAHDLVAGQADVQLLAGQGVTGVARENGRMALALEGGGALRARLLVAADSRFSQLRSMLGIGARSRDHGKRMLVCRDRKSVV